MLEWLKTILGETYTEEIDKKVSAEIGKGFVSKTDFNSLNDTKKQLEEDIKTRDNQIADLSKVDAKDLQATIEQLKTDNETAKQNYEAQLNQQKIDNAVTLALTEAKAKNVKAVKALLNDLDKAELQEDGTVKGLKESIEALKKADDSKFMFDSAEKVKLKGFEPGSGKDGLPAQSQNNQGMSLSDAVRNALSPADHTDI